jgi:hypothetical protein
MNTLEYIRNNSNNQSRFSDELLNVKWERATIHNPIELMHNISQFIQRNQFYETSKIRNTVVLEGKVKSIEIIYQKNLAPDYCIFRNTTHDGTLLFSAEKLNEIFKILYFGEAYCTNNAPEDYIDNFWEYDIRYTISDLLWNVENVDKIDPEHGKNFPGQKDSFALAVGVEYIKHQ